ncbi:DUF4175 domain-containing protein [Streptomyces hainanensis]|uniref:DUF4175 domain-containing protein n=1 Tax=Streptomyces hainanensis TaxID=402648 RepID=UPI0014051EA3|nr:DUF4175 domain-containing protein [Streptomyces hainanensis]
MGPDRALAAAEASGDPVAIGASARRVARGLIHQHRHGAATEYATARANAPRPDLEQARTPGLSTLGMLYLVGAIGATGSGRSPTAVSTAGDRLGAAAEVADQQGGDGADFTSFGATNVRLHEVDVLPRLDDARAAVEQPAPEEVRRPAAVAVVRDLLLLVPSPSPELRSLAERCGLRA